MVVLMTMNGCFGGSTTTPEEETPTTRIEVSPPSTVPTVPTTTTTTTSTTRPPGVPFQHVVQAGDVLSNIAAQYRVTVDAIVEANNIEDPDSIFVGQELVIPLPSEGN